MNLLQEIKNIPGIIVWSQETSDDKDVLTCKYNWVLREEDFGFIHLPKTAFNNLNWKKQKNGEYSETHFYWNESKIPIILETKIYHGYVIDNMRFSIEFDLELELPTRPGDLFQVKNIVSNFESMKKEIEISLRDSIPKNLPKV